MSYVHHIPGRIRIRINAAKGDANHGRACEAWLRSEEGVRRVEVNPLTGNALIYYRPEAVQGESLIRRIREREGTAPRALRPEPVFRDPIARKLFEIVAQAALERCLVALVAAVL